MYSVSVSSLGLGSEGLEVTGNPFIDFSRFWIRCVQSHLGQVRCLLRSAYPSDRIAIKLHSFTSVESFKTHKQVPLFKVQTVIAV